MTIYSQFDKPSLHLSIGLAEPYADLKGSNYLMFGTYQNIQTTLIDSNYIKNHYAAKTGFQINGAGKINFDKYNIVRGLAFISFSSFNTFESNKSGNQIIMINNQPYAVPLTYSYNFQVFSFGLGMEIAPTSFTNVFTPFVGANLSFNNFTSKLERTEGSETDTTRFTANGFRIGANLNGGIEFKPNKMVGIVLGIKYDFGNLLLKNSSNSNISERYEWGRTNAELNDEEGTYISNLPNYLYDANFKIYSSKKKDINWGSAYMGVNIYFNTAKKKAPTKK
jgi:hypothetical protein